jgi:hypothetical protein
LLNRHPVDAKREHRVRGFIVISGTGIKDIREWTPGATEVLRLVLAHMKLRRPGVRIEDRRGNPVTFFELKALAELEAKDSRT